MVIVVGTLHYALTYLLLLQNLHYVIPVGDAFFSQLTFWIVMAILLSLGVLWRLHRIDLDLFISLACTVAAMYLSTLAVAVGNSFFGQHFVFAVPTLIALFAVLFKSEHFNESKSLQLIGSVVIMIVVSFFADFAWVVDANKADVANNSEANAVEIDQFNGLMTNCGFKHYLNMGLSGQPLLDYYRSRQPDRRVWTLDADEASPSLAPYTEKETQR